jgi:ribonucleotide monophosphatase NagD (HAD superfamily)
MKKSAVIFDIDGLLINSHYGIKQRVKFLGNMAYY